MTPKVGPITAIIGESICVQKVPSVSYTPVPKGRGGAASGGGVAAGCVRV